MPETSLDLCDLSPIGKKHYATPRRARKKLAKRDNGESSAGSSTPNRQSPHILSQSMNSPSSSFPYSQDNRPDVVWDYNSPRLLKGDKKKEIKLTIQELLENLHQNQTPEPNSQSGQYVKLLENWMAKQAVGNTTKKIEKSKREKQKQSRRAIEELKKFLETIPRRKEECNTTSKSPEPVSNRGCLNDASNLNTSANSFFEGDGTENDSTEELWGEPDNSFIVKATQELEPVPTTSAIKVIPSTTEVVSTIPDSLLPLGVVNSTSEQTISCNKFTVNMEKYNSFLEQLTNMDWGSDDDDDDDWDNGFIQDDLSLIPDEVLSGSKVSLDDDRTISYTYTNKPSSSDVVRNGAMCNPPPTEVLEHKGSSYGSSFLGAAECDLGEAGSTELFNSFEDESLEDVSLLCQPEVLSRLDEVESLMSQQPRCTPEEIEKKKVEAIKRRKKIL